MITAAPTAANCTRHRYLERCSQDTLTLTRYILQLLPLSFPVPLARKGVDCVEAAPCGRLRGCCCEVHESTACRHVLDWRMRTMLSFFLLRTSLCLLDQEAKGIASIYEWQEKCLDEFLACANKRLVYSLPTGKSYPSNTIIASISPKRSSVPRVACFAAETERMSTADYSL